jgi:hypothetical protein
MLAHARRAIVKKNNGLSIFLPPLTICSKLVIFSAKLIFKQVAGTPQK